MECTHGLIDNVLQMAQFNNIVVDDENMVITHRVPMSFVYGLTHVGGHVHAEVIEYTEHLVAPGAHVRLTDLAIT